MIPFGISSVNQSEINCSAYAPAQCYIPSNVAFPAAPHANCKFSGIMPAPEILPYGVSEAFLYANPTPAQNFPDPPRKFWRQVTQSHHFVEHWFFRMIETAKFCKRYIYEIK